MNWICVFFVLASVTPFAAAQSKAAVKQTDPACGPSHAKFLVKTQTGPHPVPMKPGTAVVYVIEEIRKPANQLLGGPTIRIGMDGHWMGAGHGNSYLFFPADAGEHHVCANWQSVLKRFSKLTSLNDFNAQPGHTYYFRARVVVTGAQGPITLDLEPTNADEAGRLISKYPYAASTAKR